MNDQVQPIEINDTNHTIHEIKSYRYSLGGAGKGPNQKVMYFINYQLNLRDNYSLERQRQNSLPHLERHNFNRNLIIIYVLKKISDLQMDVNMAKVILNQMDEDLFTENSQNKILSTVIERLMLKEEISSSEQKQRAYSFAGVSKKLKQFLGVDQRQVEEEKQEEKQEEIHCQICMCDYAPIETVRIEGCFHQFCKSCIGLYLENLITSSQVVHIKCPDQYCGKQFLDQQIQQSIDSALFQKMLKFRNIKILMEDENVRFCPRPGCEKHIIRKSKKEKQIVCECGQSICFDCGSSTHDRSCEAAIDKNFRLAQKQFVIQKCSACKSPIQKNAGCNHMTCHTCKYEFCWLCRSKYSENHYGSYNILGCPGMGTSDRAPFSYPNFYRFLAVLGFIIFGIPLLAIVAVIALIVAVLCYVIVILFLPVIYVNVSGMNEFDSKCLKVIVIFFEAIISIAITPLTILFSPVAAILLIMEQVYDD